MKNSNKFSKLTSVSTLLAITLLVSSCNQVVSRRDSLAPSFGNAMAANTALQTIDPWPRNVENTHIHTDGVKTGNAIERYQTPVSSEESSSSSAVQAAEIAPKTLLVNKKPEEVRINRWQVTQELALKKYAQFHQTIS